MSDIAFSEGASKYLTHLQAKGMIESWRITRRKLGLAPPAWHLADIRVVLGDVSFLG